VPGGASAILWCKVVCHTVVPDGVSATLAEPVFCDSHPCLTTDYPCQLRVTLRLTF